MLFKVGAMDSAKFASEKNELRYTIVGATEVCLGTQLTYKIHPVPKSDESVNWTISNGIFPEMMAFTATGNKVNVIWTNIQRQKNPIFEITATIENRKSKTNNISLKVKEIDISPIISGSLEVFSNTFQQYSINYSEGEKYEWKIIPPHAGSIVNYPQGHQVEILWHNVTEKAEAEIHVRIQKCSRRFYTATSILITNENSSTLEKKEFDLGDSCEFEIPSLEIIAKKKNCSGSAVQFSVEPPHPSYTYYWDFNDRATSTLPNPVRNFDASVSRSSTVELTITNANGCTLKKQVFIENYDFEMNGQLSLSSPLPKMGETVQLLYTPFGMGAAPELFIWHHYQQGKLVKTFTTTQSYSSTNEPGLYVLDGKDQNGCIQYYIDSIEVVFVKE
ncbi:PKD domain-containing protein [Aequorivita echinoideorum]|uniref:PKD domain-containing protein n=1 Tax=Aequorivita echinoideorum TaxID=1549647 RepID=A0ABS5S590_9FLAO|nr:PKD domain-containing protein [Aequorivita echinoideorum]MBT0608375.1 PKD domain-containing protein [Aequorivita echinoideorum]